jgi:hypothetical protein
MDSAKPVEMTEETHQPSHDEDTIIVNMNPQNTDPSSRLPERSSSSEAVENDVHAFELLRTSSPDEAVEYDVHAFELPRTSSSEEAVEGDVHAFEIHRNISQNHFLNPTGKKCKMKSITFSKITFSTSSLSHRFDVCLRSCKVAIKCDQLAHRCGVGLPGSGCAAAVRVTDGGGHSHHLIAAIAHQKGTHHNY